MGCQHDTRWDVFFSYARSDRGEVLPLVDALRQHGLRVFVDESAVRGFNSLTAEISSALASSTLLLAYYSRSYPTRLPCQWELTTAFTIGLQAGNAGQRIIIVNPESGNSHIALSELRDSRTWRPPQNPDEVKALVSTISDQLESVPGPIGAPRESGYPMPPGFAGRYAQMWSLHTALGGRTETLGTTAFSAQAQVVGLPGVGKSALARAYISCLGVPFDGKVEWHDIESATNSDRPALRGGLIIVDDLTGEEADRLRPWLQQRRTDEAVLLLTRQCLYLPIHTFWLNELEDNTAAMLLSTYRIPEDDAEARTAALAAQQVGGHPQSLHLAGQLLRHHGPVSYRQLLDDWQQTDVDVPRLLAERLQTLCDGYPANYHTQMRSALPSEDSVDMELLRAVATVPEARCTTAFLQWFAPRYLQRPENTMVIIERLIRRGVIEKPSPGRFRVPAVVRRVLQRYEPNTSRHQGIHTATSRMVNEYMTTQASHTDGSNMSREPLTGIEREVAYDLLLELRTRVSTVPLRAEDGILREALASLKALFDQARSSSRTLLKETNSGVIQARLDETMSAIRQFLSVWHPALTDHESLRPADVGIIEHERAWERAEQFRTELAELQASLRATQQELEDITGTSFTLGEQ